MSTDHPSKLFGTAGRAFHGLENQGVNTHAFLQRLIDDPDFRDKIVAVIANTDAYSNIWDRIASYRIQMLTYELLGPDYQYSAVGDIQLWWNKLSLINQFRFLTEGLSDRDIDIYCQINGMYRVDGGEPCTPQSEVAEQYGLPVSFIKTIAEYAQLHIKANGVQLQQGRKLMSTN